MYDELTMINTLDKDFAPLPTYPLVLLLKGDDYNVNLFKERAQGKGTLPGMPPYDPNKIVHGEQSLEVFKPFPVDGGVFTAKKICTGVFDKGKFELKRTFISNEQAWLICNAFIH